jgi:hypothetical protein
MVRVAVLTLALTISAASAEDDPLGRFQDRLQQNSEMDRIRSDQRRMQDEMRRQEIDMRNERERSRVEQLKRDDWRRNIER